MHTMHEDHIKSSEIYTVVVVAVASISECLESLDRNQKNVLQMFLSQQSKDGIE